MVSLMCASQLHVTIVMRNTLSVVWTAHRSIASVARTVRIRVWSLRLALLGKVRAQHRPPQCPRLSPHLSPVQHRQSHQVWHQSTVWGRGQRAMQNVPSNTVSLCQSEAAGMHVNTCTVSRACVPTARVNALGVWRNSRSVRWTVRGFIALVERIVQIRV
jgi:hypothetical protein